MNYPEKVKASSRRLNPEALLADGLDPGLIGYAEIEQGFVAVYSVARCMKYIAERDGIDEDDALEHLDVNVRGSFLGDFTPLFVDEPWL